MSDMRNSKKLEHAKRAGVATVLANGYRLRISELERALQAADQMAKDVDEYMSRDSAVNRSILRDALAAYRKARGPV